MEKPAQDTGKIAKSAGTVGVAVMCSRILGLIREQVFAIFFGAGFAFDAFVVAFRIPNLLRDLFGEGALSAAFVTVFSDYETNKGAKATWALAGNVLVFVGILLSCITLLGVVFSEQIVGFLVEAGFESIPGKVALTSLLSMIMFPFLIFISLSAVVMGILNTRGLFFVPALASGFFNLGSIIGGVGFALLMPRFGQPPIVGMAIGTLIGGLLQLVCQLPTLFRAGFIFVPRLDLKHPGLRRIMKLMAPAVIGLAPLQINVLINTYFASSLAEGSLSWLSYAFRLFWLPVGIFGVALSTATLPVIARYAALKDMVRLRETYTSSLTLAFSLTIPASIGLIMLGELITRVIFQHGSFDSLATVRTAEALACYAVGLFAYSSVKIMVPVFYALDEARYPVLGSFLTMVVNVVLVWLTIDLLQHQALALSISCAMILNFLFLSTVLYKKLAGYSLHYLFAGLGKVICASLIMALGLFGIKYLFAPLAVASFQGSMVVLAISMVTGVSIYGIVLYALRFKELTMLVGGIRQRFGL
ncbi:MAG TPA: murein biosynthesis integral membrane protein MurJ [Desulfobulbaceae bacterium]|nr:MAG: murein biosynthesis integral membrane protein MurJ [Deltaproteobacteria bacterium RIFOXYD12_FULL_53_23]HCC55085.1 murein biosynthesis integral membrane protein MurJ [Desulfobulbaceae bacterium]